MAPKAEDGVSARSLPTLSEPVLLFGTEGLTTPRAFLKEPQKSLREPEEALQKALPIPQNFCTKIHMFCQLLGQSVGERGPHDTALAILVAVELGTRKQLLCCAAQRSWGVSVGQEGLLHCSLQSTGQPHPPLPGSNSPSWHSALQEVQGADPSAGLDAMGLQPLAHRVPCERGWLDQGLHLRQ